MTDKKSDRSNGKKITITIDILPGGDIQISVWEGENGISLSDISQAALEKLSAQIEGIKKKLKLPKFNEYVETSEPPHTAATPAKKYSKPS